METEEKAPIEASEPAEGTKNSAEATGKNAIEKADGASGQTSAKNVKEPAAKKEARE